MTVTNRCCGARRQNTVPADMPCVSCAVPRGTFCVLNLLSLLMLLSDCCSPCCTCSAVVMLSTVHNLDRRFLAVYTSCRDICCFCFVPPDTTAQVAPCKPHTDFWSSCRMPQVFRSCLSHHQRRLWWCQMQSTHLANLSSRRTAKGSLQRRLCLESVLML